MKKLGSAGFGIAIWILIIILLAGIGYGGWYVYSKNKSKPAASNLANNSTGSSQAQTNTDPYNGWKTYTTTYEKMTFKYPSDLTITDTSHASVAGQDNVSPGMDTIKLAGAGGFAVSIQTGLDGIGAGCPECTIDFSDPITFAGTSYYINFVNTGTGKISSVTVSKITNDFVGTVDGKNITINGSSNKAATLISASFRDANDMIIEKTLAQYKADHFIKEFKLLVESISYSN